MAVISSVPVYLCIILLLISVSNSNSIISSETEDYRDVIFLKPNEQHRKDTNDVFVTFCFDSVPKSFLQIWRSVQCVLEQAPLSYEIFTGENASDVKNKYSAKSIWSPSSWLIGQKTNVDFPAFSNYCVGIATAENYVIYLKVRVINYWRVLQTVTGIILFLSAPSLSRNPFFHYTSGVSVGVLASLLILIFFLSKFIPQKSASYAIIVFGYSLVLYVLQVIWQHLNDIISNYMDIVLIYCFCSAFISFLVCYRLGPVQNVRTFNVIQWCMQVIAVILIYLGSEYREVSTAVIIILLTVQLIPSSWISYAKRLWYRFFPPKIRLLTELEYIEQGSRETTKALEELKKFCRSPDCNTWKVVRRLKDPIRFSTFIETGNHYTDDELLRYNSEGFDEEDAESETEHSSNTSNGFVTPVRSYWNHK